MPEIKPYNVPQQGHLETLNILGGYGVFEKVALLGVRGYYLDTMGSKGKNDRGIYDDALFLVGPSFYGSFNANTDPSAYRKGSGRGSDKGMASLKPGVYRAWRVGTHNGSSPHEALVQRIAKVTVVRDGNPPYEDTGMFGINIHRGGKTGTSSIGCQTVHPDQWSYFISKVKEQLKAAEQTVMPYCLIEA